MMPCCLARSINERGPDNLSFFMILDLCVLTVDSVICKVLATSLTVCPFRSCKTNSNSRSDSRSNGLYLVAPINSLETMVISVSLK